MEKERALAVEGNCLCWWESPGATNLPPAGHRGTLSQGQEWEDEGLGQWVAPFPSLALTR